MSASDPQSEAQSGADEARLLELELAKAQAEARAAELVAKARALEAELARKQAAQRGQEDAPSESSETEASASTRARAAVSDSAGPAGKPVAEQPSPAGTKAPPNVGASAPRVGATRRPAERQKAVRDKDASAARRESAGEEGSKRGRAAIATVGAVAEAEPARRRWAMSRFLRASSSWMLSMVVHLLAMIILGLWLLPVPEGQDLLPLMASVDADQLEELEELELDEFEMDQMEALAFDVQDPGMAELGDTVELEASEVEAVTMSVSDTMDTIGTLFGEHGKGWASVGTGSGGAEFYGAKTRGKRFVFIIDNSLSMTKGRFESALYELMYTIGKMGSDQEFYVFFFSDTAYPLFYPRSAPGMVKATKESKQALYQWLATVPLVLRTDAKEAVQRALLMQPHGIYILTDGAFTDDTARFLLDKAGVEKFIKSKSDRYYRPPTIHTVGMEINKAGAEKGLKEIAVAYNGSFRHVRANPQMALAAKRNPRQRFNKPGPVWGVALGNKRAKRGAPPGRAPGAKRQGGKKKGGKKN